MDEMVTWLREQMDDDEAAARTAMHSNGVWTHDGMWGSGTSVTDAQGGSVARGHGSGDWSLHAHIARHDPASVLADVAAKRAIVDLHALERSAEWHYWQRGEDDGPPEHEWGCVVCDHVDWSVYPKGTDGCQTLRLLTETYAHRDGYREEWRPAKGRRSQ